MQGSNVNFQVVAMEGRSSSPTTSSSSTTQSQQSSKRGLRASITFQQLQQVFHLARPDAAAQLGIGMSTLKRACQQHGVTRWPYRKLQALQQLEQIMVSGQQCKLGAHGTVVSKELVRQNIAKIVQAPDTKMLKGIRKQLSKAYRQRYVTKVSSTQRLTPPPDDATAISALSPNHTKQEAPCHGCHEQAACLHHPAALPATCQPAALPASPRCLHPMPPVPTPTTTSRTNGGGSACRSSASSREGKTPNEVVGLHAPGACTASSPPTWDEVLEQCLQALEEAPVSHHQTEAGAAAGLADCTAAPCLQQQPLHPAHHADYTQQASAVAARSIQCVNFGSSSFQEPAWHQAATSSSGACADAVQHTSGCQWASWQPAPQPRHNGFLPPSHPCAAGCLPAAAHVPQLPLLPHGHHNVLAGPTTLAPQPLADSCNAPAPSLFGGASWLATTCSPFSSNTASKHARLRTSLGGAAMEEWVQHQWQAATDSSVTSLWPVSHNNGMPASLGCPAAVPCDVAQPSQQQQRLLMSPAFSSATHGAYSAGVGWAGGAATLQGNPLPCLGPPWPELTQWLHETTTCAKCYPTDMEVEELFYNIQAGCTW